MVCKLRHCSMPQLAALLALVSSTCAHLHVACSPQSGLSSVPIPARTVNKGLSSRTKVPRNMQSTRGLLHFTPLAGGPSGSARRHAEPVCTQPVSFWDKGCILRPSSFPGWDARAAAMPCVLPPCPERPMWQMWYYGRATDEWANGVSAFLPTGAVGLAESADGLHWVKVAGVEAGGAFLTPSQDPDAWDNLHVGVTDVHSLPGGSLLMLYLGGSKEAVEADGLGGAPIAGMRMRPGAAVSRNGREWEKRGAPLLEPGLPGEWDSLFASWLRAVPQSIDQPDGPWIATYHALQPADIEGTAPCWAVGAALCRAGHPLGPYEKLGRVLEGGGVGSWDEQGIGTRHMLHHKGELWMMYEGVDAKGTHALGLAKSADGGFTWRKQAGPVFEPRTGAPVWDSKNVGTPWLVRLKDGRFRLYYIGTGKDVDGKINYAIGAAESIDDGLERWKRVKSTVDMKDAS